MVVCDKVFSDSFLGKLSKVISENPQRPRRELAREVCDWLNWVDHNGKPKISSCMKSFSILRKKGLLSFPEIEKKYSFNKKTCREKQIKLEAIECSLEEAGKITIEQVKTKNSKSFHIWREIMENYHYLKNSRLCGSQIKYLIKSSNFGLLGALSFSSAQFSLAKRDEAIGWTPEARRANLSKVVNNSRFCILPKVDIPNLCSKALSLSCKRLPEDWFKKYGEHPVLIETFVDKSKYQGTIYKSSNWVNVGKSAGRRDNNPKTIYIKSLTKDWKDILQKEKIHDTFNEPHKDEPNDWAVEEFGRISLSDERLRNRLYKIARSFFSSPASALTLSMGSKADYYAMCRFFKNENISMEKLLEPHLSETVTRIKKESVVLIPQDTVYLDYSTQADMRDDLGPIGTTVEGKIGLTVHDTVAFSADGTPLGVIDIQCWRRDPEEHGKSKSAKRRPIEEKESIKWLNSFTRTEKVALECKNTLVVSVCDREGDIFDFFYHAKDAKAKIIVRHTKYTNREIDGRKIIDSLQESKKSKTYEISLPKRGGKKTRIATVEIRYQTGQIAPPKSSKIENSVKLTAVQIIEVGEIPKDENRLEWILLTSLDVKSFDDALLITKYYAKRWNIETYHKTMKSGCLIESRQIEGLKSLRTAIALDMIVAYRVLYMTMVSREKPDVPSTEIFTEAEWQTIHLLKTGNVPKTTPTLKATVILLAMLGGYFNRKSDSPPGIKVIWRGLQGIRLAVKMHEMYNPSVPPKPR